MALYISDRGLVLLSSYWEFEGETCNTYRASKRKDHSTTCVSCSYSVTVSKPRERHLRVPWWSWESFSQSTLGSRLIIYSSWSNHSLLMVTLLDNIREGWVHLTSSEVG
ncbi:hypothetical protein HZ326_17046 [Fusarium oxysporum f. sp. albedinis]|nr:hypothetical protein HZ326_17046 [Fusarium oxysporum f. sp. albedinis]